MNNAELSKKIKGLRLAKAYSQEQLANNSGLSLRTVQRIENGETEPRGDTLVRLAKSLGVTPNELIDWTEVQDHQYLMVMNLSAFSFLVVPLLGIIIPLILWILQKDKIRNVDAVGKEILNFQITFCMASFLFFIGGALFKILHYSPLSLLTMDTGELMLLIGLLSYPYNIIITAINCFKSYRSGQVFYFPAIPFLKRT